MVFVCQWQSCYGAGLDGRCGCGLFGWLGLVRVFRGVEVGCWFARGRGHRWWYGGQVEVGGLVWMEGVRRLRDLVAVYIFVVGHTAPRFVVGLHDDLDIVRWLVLALARLGHFGVWARSGHGKLLLLSISGGRRPIYASPTPDSSPETLARYCRHP